MFTKENKLELCDFTVTKGTASLKDGCLSIIPEAASVDDDEILLEMQYNGTSSGFKWGENDYLIIECMGEMRSKLSLDTNFYSGENKLFRLNYSLIGNRRVKCCFSLHDLDSSHVFLPTLPGHLKGHAHGQPTHIDSCNGIHLCVHKGRDFKKLCIYAVYVTSSIPDLSVDGAPLVDKLGQWKDCEWEGKFHSEKEMVDFLHGELNKARASNGYKNPDWDSYGGWKKKHFEVKNHFYVTEENGRKWLVTPEGNAFFSNGVCYGSRMGVHGFVDGMEPLFDFLPSKNDKEFHDAWTTADNIPEFVKRNGIEAGKGRFMYNFARSNMIRAFGADKWWDSWVTINSARMKEWGFNTISVCVNNYYDERVEEYLKKAEIPFCFTLKKFPKTRHLIFRDFPDVFDGEYKVLSEEFAKQIKAFADNKYFIGFFINNEPEWIFQRETNPAERLLAYPERVATKDVLVDFLRKRYESVDALNMAWNKDFASFDSLYTPMERADLFSKKASADLADFRNIMIEKYSSVPTEALTAVVPNAINLGMRYGTMTEKDFAGAEMFDVFSFNCYRRDPSEAFDLSLRCTESPFIVGEWHYGGSDTGLMSNALVNASTQEERGKACRAYLQKAFTNPHCVGAHYFEFNDQPLLGRFDGENMQHGLIDVCNRPHYPCVNAFAEINSRMYDIISGKDKPEDISWEYHYRY